jgi:hypothetical protein
MDPKMRGTGAEGPIGTLRSFQTFVHLYEM